MMKKAHTQRYRKLWEAYHKMKQECFDSTRGHKYLETFDNRWMTYYIFYEDMVDSWFPDAVLVKIDPTKPYGPDNCDWVIQKSKERICP